MTGTIIVTGGREGVAGPSSAVIAAATYSARLRSPRSERSARMTAGPTNTQSHNTRKSLAKRYTSMVRYIWIALALWTAQGAEPAGPPYASRRAELRKALPNGVVVLFGHAESDHGDLRSGFYQEPNFYYLTGWNQPGAVLVIEPARDVLFLP